MTAAWVGCAVTDTGATVTSITVSPSTVRSGSALSTGDTMILTVIGSVQAAGVPTTPTGWTLLANGYEGTRRYGVYTRVRQSGDSTYTVTIPSSNGAQATVHWFTGADGASVFAGSSLLRSTTTTISVCPSMTTTDNDSLVVSVNLEASAASESAPSATLSSLGAGAGYFAPQTTTPQVMTTYVGSFTKATAGATGDDTLTYTNSSARALGVQVAIPPALATNTAPVAKFEYQRTGMSVAFTDLSTDSDGTVDAWAWDFDDTNTSTSQNPTHAYGSSGTYTVGLTVTDNDAADSTQTTHDVVVPATLENSGSWTLFDAFARYGPDGTTPDGKTALTGQTWAIYSGPSHIAGGLWDSGDGTTVDDTAAYIYPATDLTDEITTVGSRFTFDTLGSTHTANTGTACIGITNDIANLGARKFRAHAVMTPTAVIVMTQMTAGGSLTTRGSASITAAKDAEHTFEMTVSGTTCTLYVDGVQELQVTHADFADTTEYRQPFFEPYYNNDASAVRVRHAEVWAAAGVAYTGTATAASTGTTTGTGVVGKVATAVLAATVALTAAGIVGTSSTATLPATATITAAGATTVGYTGTAALSSTATLTAAGVRALATGSSLPVTDTITTAGVVAFGTGAGLSGTDTLTAAGTVTTHLSGSVALGSTGALTAAGTVARGAGSTLVAADAITATGSVTVGIVSDSALNAAATLTSTGVVAKGTTATLVASDSIDAVGVVVCATGAMLASLSTFIASGSVVAGLSGDVALAATGAITATGSVVTGTASALTASDTIVVSGVVARATDSIVSATGTIHAVGVVAVASSATLTSAVTLDASGSVAIRTSGVSVLGATGALTTAGLVATTGAITITGTDHIIATGMMTSAGTTVLDTTATITTAGTVEGAQRDITIVIMTGPTAPAMYIIGPVGYPLFAVGPTGRILIVTEPRS